MGNARRFCPQELWMQGYRRHSGEESDSIWQRAYLEKRSCYTNTITYDVLSFSQGGDPERAKIVCTDARYIPGGKGAYTKIVSLEMAEVRETRKR